MQVANPPAKSPESAPQVLLPQPMPGGCSFWAHKLPPYSEYAPDIRMQPPLVGGRILLCQSRLFVRFKVGERGCGVPVANLRRVVTQCARVVLSGSQHSRCRVLDTIFHRTGLHPKRPISGQYKKRHFASNCRPRGQAGLFPPNRSRPPIALLSDPRTRP